MIRLIAASVLAVSFTSEVVADEELLTLGDHAPKFNTGEFIQGTALTKLSRGTVYVIEFSGTRCAPCIRLIPHMEKLQRKHKNVIFISVFSESADGVRKFLNGVGKDITLRIVCDADRTMWRSWSIASGQVGIPHVFVVDSDSKIAWIGNPEELSESLAKIVAGKHDYHVDPVERMRLDINRHATLKQRLLNDRKNEARRLNRERVTALIREKKNEEAIELIDKAMETYGDLPIVNAFRARKLFLLGRVSGRRHEAFVLARDIAVDARLNGSPTVTGAAKYLMNHFENADPENRDKRMINLALALLGDSVPSLEGSARSLGQRSSHSQSLARAYHLRGDRARATAALRQAIAANEKQIRQLRINNEEQWYMDEVEQGLNTLRKRLTTYKAD